MRQQYYILILFSITTFTSIISEIVPSSEFLDNNPLISHWPDEDEMRNRMEEYAREKFSQHYHFKNISENSTKKLPKKIFKRRDKRDGGLISGPVATAVVTGMIGMTAKAVTDIVNYHPSVSEGGCEWFGTAPFCNYPCPSEYDYIRPSNGRCSSFWLSGICKPDPSFGEPCSTILGTYFRKRFCCKSDPRECSWSGRWMGANNAYNSYCRYDNSVGVCGEITCSINHFEFKAQDTSEIYGSKCDQIDMFNATGKATCGYIAWFDSERNLVNSWYKSR